MSFSKLLGFLSLQLSFKIIWSVNYYLQRCSVTEWVGIRPYFLSVAREIIHIDFIFLSSFPFPMQTCPLLLRVFTKVRPASCLYALPRVHLPNSYCKWHPVFNWTHRPSGSFSFPMFSNAFSCPTTLALHSAFNISISFTMLWKNLDLCLIN